MAAVTSGTLLIARPMVIDELAARNLFGDRNAVGLEANAHDLNDVFTIVDLSLWHRSFS
jgi:hypothetical protein